MDAKLERNVDSKMHHRNKILNAYSVNYSPKKEVNPELSKRKDIIKSIA
jgi:hypothetical protein